MNDLADRLKNLTPEQRQALEEQLRRRLTPTTPAGIPRRLPGARAPLSFAQQRLWFLDQLYPGLAAFNEPGAFQVQGELDLSCLENSLGALLARHSALRSVFFEQDGQTWQRVLPEQAFTPQQLLEHLDLSGLDGEAQPAALEAAQRVFIARPFDLQSGPLLRGLLLRLGPGSFHLLLVKHHIASDGWSAGLLYRDLWSLYQSARSGEPAQLPELPVEYADYSLWQREQMQGQKLELLMAYWQAQLADLQPLSLPAPTSRRRAGVQPQARLPGVDFSGSQLRQALPPALVEALQALARQERVTLYMLLLAAFQVLLYRTSGQSDVCLGSPIAQRTHPDTEQLVGVFVNTLVQRSRVPGQATFQAFLTQVRAAALQAFEHQELPFEKLVEVLQPERDLGRHPLVQIMFQIFDPGEMRYDQPGIQVERRLIDSGFAKVDLTLHFIWEQDPSGQRQLVGHWIYQLQHLEADSVRRMATHMECLLQAIVEQPGARLDDLPLLNSSELVELYAWGHQPLGSPPAHNLAHAGFLAQAARQPEALAVSGKGQDGAPLSYTYAQLEALSRRVAQSILALDLPGGTQAIIGILADHSPQMIAALLGVLRAGAAYVPLSPEQPVLRLGQIAASAGLHAVIDPLGNGLGLPPGVPLLSLEPQDTALRSPAAALPEHLLPDSLAYVLYTSGSSGEPKGVMVSQRQLCAYIHSAMQLYALSPGVYAMLQPLTVDSCLTMLFPALWSGGELRLVERQAALDAAGLAAEFEQRPIDYLKIAPSHLSLLLEVAGAHHLLPRRVLVIGGETAGWGLVERLAALQAESGNRCQVWNHYGPTETTVGVLSAPVILQGQIQELGGASVPIGRPLPGVHVAIVDAQGSLLPTGLPGELLIGGEQVACGYLGRPELTRQVFFEDQRNWFPLAGGSVRGYRSGDQARWLPGGWVEFLGRNDDQIKLRGQRIELGEIEAALETHPDIAEQAVLLVPGQPPYGPLLAAFIAPHTGRRLDLTQVRQFLAARLPEVMLPTSLQLLDRLPRTAHGKLNRQELIRLWQPDAPGSGAETGEALDAWQPVSAEEQQLAQIWREVLGVPKVRGGDNFFNLGGHSLLVIQVLARLRNAFQAGLSVPEFFSTPTLAGQARLLRTAMQTASHPPGLAPNTLPRYPLSFPQQRMWFLQQLEPDSPAYNQTTLLRFLGPFDLQALQHSLDSLVQRHEILRTLYQHQEGVPYQLVEPFHPLKIEQVRLDGLDEPSAGVALRQDMDQRVLLPIDLAREWPIRAILYHLSDQEQRLLLVCHHIASDGWSDANLEKELVEAYAAQRQGREAVLPELARQVRDFAAYQLDNLNQSRTADDQAYWQARLTHLPRLELPTDFPRPAQAGYQGEELRFAIPPELLAQLDHLGSEAKATRFMLLLSAWAVLLSRYSGQSDFSIGVPFAGRTQRSFNPLIGFFINTLLLRIKLQDAGNARQLLDQVRQTLLEALSHSTMPYEMVAELVQRQRPGQRQELVQAFCQLQRVGLEAAWQAGDCRIERLYLPASLVRFDLELVFYQDQDGLEGVLRYRRELFRPERIQHMAEHLLNLLAEMVRQPDQALATLPLLTPAQTAAVLQAAPWTRPASLSELPCVPDLVLEQAQHQPQAVALEQGDVCWSYARLSQEARRVAGALLSVGLEPGEVVEVSGASVPERVAALLGVLVGGGVILPADPQLPPARLRQMRLAARQGLAPGQAGNRPRALRLRYRLEACPSESIQRWTLAQIDAQGEPGPASPLPQAEALPPGWLRPRLPGDPAYIFFTSGSTGAPLGILGSHPALAHFIIWQRQTFGIGAQDRAAQLTGLAFDVLLRDIFTPLCAGATLVLPPASGLAPGDTLDWLSQQEISLAHCVPSLAAAWLALRSPGGCGAPHLRLVFFAGEPLSGELVSRLREWRAPTQAGAVPLRVINLYGPSETTLAKTWYEVPEPAAPGVQPLGKTLPGSQALVFNTSGNLCGTGELGRIAIRTPFRSLGYLGEPGPAAARFAPLPFTDQSAAGSELLFWTGDLGRITPQGLLTIHGREDEQVKLRGARVEPAEVSTVLHTLPGVAQATVIALGAGALESVPQEPRLVAFCVPMPGAKLDVLELSRQLLERLPAFMLPAHFLLLSELPLTPGGKTDRQQLVRLARSALSAKAMPEVGMPEMPTVAPRDELETRLSHIWSEVLPAPPPGVHHNFFNLGGHSLLAIQVIARMHRLLGASLDLRQFFHNPTIAEQAALLRLLADSEADWDHSPESGEIEIII